MPLLGKKIFICANPLKDISTNEAVYTIPHTKEQFRSKKEFDKRNSWYKDRIWTCRCTGHVNLTHEEAWLSEKTVRKSLKEQFNYCHQKPVLELVHHSSLSLDTLVDQAWLKLQQVISIGENVSLKVKTAGKIISGQITKINTAGIDADPCSNCNSPSSDKENADDSNRDESPKKWQPPKLLPYKYSLRLKDQDRVINEVPASDLSRQDKPPSKENLRLFIRANALRVGQNSNSPWVVDEAKVKEFGLPQKFAHFLMSPVKTAEMDTEYSENHKKRKLASPTTSAAKKAKIDKGKNSKKNKDDKKQTKLTGSPVIKKSTSKLKLSKKLMDSKSPKKSPKGSKEVIDLSSDEDCPLSKLKASPEKKKSPTKHKSTPKKETSVSKKSTPMKKDKNGKREKRTPKKEKNIEMDSDSDEDKPLAKLKLTPKKNMKQMTLFDMSKKKGMKTPEKKASLKGLKTPEKGMKTPDKKSRMMSPPKTPAIVSKLVRAVKNEEQTKIKALVHQAANMLTSPQRKKLPPEVKEIVQKRFLFLEEKKKLAKMSDEEKTQYLKQKKEALKRKQRERVKELRKKFEDQDLTHKPLPPPKLVPTPDGLPNEMFGDITMVTEFISCYSGLLMPDETYPILTDALMKALTTGKEGFTYLSRALVVLLQTLLQDQIAEDYQEVKVPLSDIPVNPYTASELIRLCLRRQDVDDDDSDNEFEEEEEEVSDDVIQLLETQELFQLEPVQKASILKGLCLRLMGTYSVQDYMEEKQRDASKLWKRKIAELKTKNDKKKQEKQLKKEEKNENKDNQKPDEKGLSIPHFYGKEPPESEESKPSTPEPTSAESAEECEDLVSIVKRRRILSARAAAEKEKRDEERRKQKEKEYELYHKQREQENFEKTFNEGIALAKMLLRQSPIGTDRHHSRYWIFSSTTPGLYIEKGWVSDDINYSVKVDKDQENSDASDDENESDTSTSNVNPSLSTSKEKTIPHCGQNLWFTYDTVKELDSLIENLHPQGIRESSLKAELKKRYADISKAIIMAQRTNCKLRDSDGEKEMLDSCRKELMETELRLRNGGLGGVPDFKLWEAKVETASSVSEFAKCMIETQENVLEKFRQGTMGPKKKKVKVTEVNDDEEEGKDGDEEEEEKTEAVGIKIWREAVESTATFSRLHVLLGVLDSCIKWEKSAENAKCKICRKKGSEDQLLLCDECNQAFHAYCLRPALIGIPKGDWFCAACVPQHQRRKSRGFNYADSDDSDEEEIEHEENCVECGGDEGLIFCAECPSAYHPECHDPPLRRPPRGQWVCNECKTGVKRKTRSRTVRRNAVKQKRAPPKRKRYVEESESTSEEEEESEEEEDSEEEDEEEEDVEEPPKKSSRRSQEQTSARSSSSTRNKNTGRRSAEVKDNKKTNRNSSGSNTSLTDSRTFVSRRAPSDLSICEQIIAEVMKHKSCWPFLAAVSKKDVPDYHKIIKHPMDFQLVKDKLSCLVYGSADEVLEDVKQIFINAETYNKGLEGSEVLQCKDEIEQHFAALVKKNLPLFLYARGGFMTNGFSDHENTPPTGGRRSRR